MSRIGRQPIPVPEKVKVTINNQQIEVAGPLGTLVLTIHPKIKIKLDNNQVIVERSGDDELCRSLHGLERARINNMVIGVTKGYSKELTLVGVGYRAQITGNKMNLQLGYSHQIDFDLPPGIQAKIDKQTVITITGIDKEKVGLIAARIRGLRKPEPYKGKGVRYTGERIVRKAGKAAVAGGKK